MILACGVRGDEEFISPEFGFFAIFPHKTKAHTFQNPAGEALVVSAGISKDSPVEMLMYQIIALKSKAAKDIENMSDAKNLELVQTYLDGYAKGSKCLNYKSEKYKNSKWPTLRFTCSQNDFYPNGIVSHKVGYAFLMNGTYFRVTADSLEKGEKLTASAQKLFSSFTFGEAKILEKLKRYNK